MQLIKLSYGLNPTGLFINANETQAGGIYKCPCCYTPLQLQKDNSAPYFTHEPNNICSNSSLTYGKSVIYKAMIENSQLNKQIPISQHCAQCNDEIESNFEGGEFIEIQLGTELDINSVTARKRSGGKLKVYLETQCSKAPNQSEMDGHWLVFDADSIKDGERWKPKKTSMGERLCSPCYVHNNDIREAARRFNIPDHLYSTSKHDTHLAYIAELDVCFHCNTRIPVFWFKGVPFSQLEPPEPKPSTIKYSFSELYNGFYWANTCPNCNTIQGDNHLFVLAGGVLKDLPLNREQLSGFEDNRAVTLFSQRHM